LDFHVTTIPAAATHALREDAVSAISRSLDTAFIGHHDGTAVASHTTVTPKPDFNVRGKFCVGADLIGSSRAGARAASAAAPSNALGFDAVRAFAKSDNRAATC